MDFEILVRENRGAGDERSEDGRTRCPRDRGLRNTEGYGILSDFELPGAQLKLRLHLVRLKPSVVVQPSTIYIPA
jgi:hypothetical protein